MSRAIASSRRNGLFGLRLRGGAFGVLTVLMTSCGAAPPSLLEDKARRDVPIAICRKPLTATNVNDTGVPLAEAYWSLMFPNFRDFATPLDGSTTDCIGDPLSSTERLDPVGGHAPSTLRVTPTDLTLSASDKGVQTAWLRTLPVSDHVAAGFLAVVQPRASELDAYAVGLYRGSAHNSRFEVVHMDTTVLIAAYDEGCADVKVETECESSLGFFFVRGGQIVPVGKTPLAHTQTGSLKDIGRVTYRLTTTAPTFDAHSVHIREKLSVRDSGDSEIRKSEGERVFVLRGGALEANQDTIWSQVGRP